MKVTVVKQNESVIYNGQIFKHGDEIEMDDVIAKSLTERGYVAPTASDVEAVEIAADGQDSPQSGETTESGSKSRKTTSRARAKKTEVTDEEIEESEESDELPNTDMPE